MNNLIACRTASYGNYHERAWEHLPDIGIYHVEIPVPADDEKEAVQRKLADHGLSASSLQCSCDLTRPDAAEQMAPQLRTCAELGAGICFVSVNSKGIDRELVWQRLREVAGVAKEHDVIVAAESHPDLFTDGQLARQTIEAVNHPNLRVNFDTANVSYYNQGATAVQELAKVIDYIAAVHIKDYGGGFRKWDFPTLGTGIVDFPQIFKMLGDRGFTGPYTMELEGIKGVEYDEAGRLKYVADSVAYLRKIGVLGD